MGSRLEFHELLVDILGSRNVYFQPPENVKIKYPCIIYQLSRPDVRNANNKKYFIKKRYSVTVVDTDPEGKIADKLSDVPYSSFDRRFVSDNLMHDVYDIYY